MEFDLCFLVLSNCGFTGLGYLVNLALREISPLSVKILDSLSRTESVLKEVVVPTLLLDVQEANHPRQRDIALAALNRLTGVCGSA